MTTTDGVPAPGFYPVGRAGLRRGWDGHIWTDEVESDAAVLAAAPWQRHPLAVVDHLWFRIAGGGFVIGIVLAVLSDTLNLTWLAPIASIGTFAVVGAFVLLTWQRLDLAEAMSAKALVGWGLVGGVVAWEIGGILERSFDHRLDLPSDSPLSMLSAGPAEEFAKLVVPVVLYLFGRYRDPRAGFAIALASGAALGMIEGFEYTIHATGIFDDMYGLNQADKMATALMATQRPLTELMHPIFTGFVAAVAWRAAWRRGSLLTWVGLGALASVMVLHSLNDFIGVRFSQIALEATAAIIIGAFYLCFRPAARQLASPDSIFRNPPNWRPRFPRRVAARPAAGAAAAEDSAAGG
ncbi:MAG: PrsW family glutamic-type intramembrane protease [Candidatus Nanopelagicales bacterium]